jgi:repressor LexA
MGKNTGYVAAGQGGHDDRGLTPLRREIMRVIEASLRDKGYPPSIREIGDAVGLASTSSVSYQLSVLEAMGYLSREAGRPRTMVVRSPGPDSDGLRAPAPGDGRVADVPLMGRIAAGLPVIADGRAEDVIPVPRMLTGEGILVALRVCGDSMIGAAIADGDWVVVREQPDADSGDIVAAMLASDATSDYEATVKTLKKSGGHVWLVPHNPAYSPILADSAVIIGKVVSVLRRLLAPGTGDPGATSVMTFGI